MSRRTKKKDEKQKKDYEITKENKEELLWINRPVFTGFLGGNVFITKKGFRSMKMDSLWVQNLLEAFKNDDDELAIICLESSIASIQDRVEGGTYGSPYCIGDYGFYAEEQFEAQLTYIKESTRNWCLRKKHYLSATEWEVLDSKLSIIAYHGKASFYDTCRGDSFAALAIRQNAFNIAKLFVSRGVDPLVENEKNQDLYQIMKVQYQVLNERLKSIQTIKNEAIHTILIPTIVTHILKQEETIISQYQALSLFADEMILNFQNRMKQIEIDKLLKRRAELRNEEFSSEKLWNIAQQNKLLKYIPELDKLKSYIEDKLKFHEIEAKNFQNLAEVLISNYNLIHQDDKIDDDSTIISMKSSNKDDRSVPFNNIIDNKSTELRNELITNTEEVSNDIDSNSNIMNDSIDSIKDDLKLLLKIKSNENNIELLQLSDLTNNINEDEEDKYSLQLPVIINSENNIAISSTKQLPSLPLLLINSIDSKELPPINNSNSNLIIPLSPISEHSVTSSISIINSNNNNSSNNNMKIPLISNDNKVKKQYYNIKLNENQSKPTMKSKEELFDKLGYNDNIKDIKNRKDNKSKMIEKLLASTKDQYLPTLGTLHETENSITMYR